MPLRASGAVLDMGGVGCEHSPLLPARPRHGTRGAPGFFQLNAWKRHPQHIAMPNAVGAHTATQAGTRCWQCFGGAGEVPHLEAVTARSSCRHTGCLLSPPMNYAGLQKKRSLRHGLIPPRAVLHGAPTFLRRSWSVRAYPLRSVRRRAAGQDWGDGEGGLRESFAFYLSLSQWYLGMRKLVRLSRKFNPGVHCSQPLICQAPSFHKCQSCPQPMRPLPPVTIRWSDTGPVLRCVVWGERCSSLSAVLYTTLVNLFPFDVWDYLLHGLREAA